MRDGPWLCAAQAHGFLHGVLWVNFTALPPQRFQFPG